MPSVDRSLIANLPLFAGLAPGELDELLREDATQGQKGVLQLLFGVGK